jgi:hypothetical protein
VIVLREYLESVSLDPFAFLLGDDLFWHHLVFEYDLLSGVICPDLTLQHHHGGTSI